MRRCEAFLMIFEVLDIVIQHFVVCMTQPLKQNVLKEKLRVEIREVFESHFHTTMHNSSVFDF